MFFFYIFHNKIIRLGLNTRHLLVQTDNDREKVILEEYRQIGKAIGLKHLPSLWVAEYEKASFEDSLRIYKPQLKKN